MMFNKRLNTILEDEFGDLDDQDTFGDVNVIAIYFFVPNIINRGNIINHIVDSITNILDEWIQEEQDSTYDNWEWEGRLRAIENIDVGNLISRIDNNVASELTSKFNIIDYFVYKLKFYTPFTYVDQYIDQLFINNFIVPYDRDGTMLSMQLSRNTNVVKKSYKIPWFIDGNYV